MAPESPPGTDVSPATLAQGHIRETSEALRVQASRILELEAEVARLEALIIANPGEGHAARRAAVRAELVARQGTAANRLTALPRRIARVVRRDGLHPRRWSGDARRWWRRLRR